MSDISNHFGNIESKTLRRIRQLWRISQVVIWILCGLLILALRLPWSRFRTTLGLLEICCWWHQGLLAILRVKLRCYGHNSAQSLLVANHVSWLDIPVIGSCLPLRILAKAELKSWPILGWLIAGAGTLFIQRGSHHTEQLNQQIGQCLQQGQSLLFFPEGTSSNGLQVLPFHARLFAAAQQQQLPIQPLCIYYPHQQRPNPVVPYINDDTFIGSLLKIAASPETQVELHFGDPVWPQGLERKALAKQTEGQIRLQLERCLASDVK